MHITIDRNIQPIVTSKNLGFEYHLGEITQPTKDELKKLKEKVDQEITVNEFFTWLLKQAILDEAKRRKNMRPQATWPFDMTTIWPRDSSLDMTQLSLETLEMMAWRCQQG